MSSPARQGYKPIKIIQVDAFGVALNPMVESEGMLARSGRFRKQTDEPPSRRVGGRQYPRRMTCLVRGAGAEATA